MADTITNLDKATLAHGMTQAFEMDAERARLLELAYEAAGQADQAKEQKTVKEQAEKKAAKIKKEYEKAVADADKNDALTVEFSQEHGAVVGRKKNTVPVE